MLIPSFFSLGRLVYNGGTYVYKSAKLPLTQRSGTNRRRTDGCFRCSACFSGVGSLDWGTAIRRPGRRVRGAAHPQRPGRVVWAAAH
jgi:hypothetical protein